MDYLQRLRDLAVSETGFVFDPVSGATFNTNVTGRTIIQGLKEGDDRFALLTRLRESFEIGEQDLDADLDDFLFMLRESGILPQDLKL